MKGRKNDKQKQSNETGGRCDAVSSGPTMSSMSVNDEIILNKSIKSYSSLIDVYIVTVFTK